MPGSCLLHWKNYLKCEGPSVLSPNKLISLEHNKVKTISISEKAALQKLRWLGISSRRKLLWEVHQEQPTYSMRFHQSKDPISLLLLFYIGYFCVLHDIIVLTDFLLHLLSWTKDKTNHSFFVVSFRNFLKDDQIIHIKIFTSINVYNIF